MLTHKLKNPDFCTTTKSNFYAENIFSICTRVCTNNIYRNNG